MLVINAAHFAAFSFSTYTALSWLSFFDHSVQLKTALVLASLIVGIRWFNEKKGADERRRYLLAIRALRLCVKNPHFLSTLDEVRSDDDLPVVLAMERRGRLPGRQYLSKNEMHDVYDDAGFDGIFDNITSALDQIDRAIVLQVKSISGPGLPIDVLSLRRTLLSHAYDELQAAVREDPKIMAARWLLSASQKLDPRSALRRLLLNAGSQLSKSSDNEEIGSWDDIRGWLKSGRIEAFEDLNGSDGPANPKEQRRIQQEKEQRRIQQEKEQRRIQQEEELEKQKQEKASQQFWDEARLETLNFQIAHEKVAISHLAKNQVVMIPSKLSEVIEQYRRKFAPRFGAGENGPQKVDVGTAIEEMHGISKDGPIIATREGSDHHGNYYSYDDLFAKIQVELSPEGLVSAYFIGVILPGIGAWWHGLYKRDHEPVLTEEKLFNLVKKHTSVFDAEDLRRLSSTPVGIRVSLEDAGFRMTCLTYSPTAGFEDRSVLVSSSGRISMGDAELLFKNWKVLY